MQLAYNYPVCARLNAHERVILFKMFMLLYCSVLAGAEDGVTLLLPVEQYAIVLLLCHSLL